MLLRKKICRLKNFSKVTKKRRKETVHKQVINSFICGCVLDLIKIHNFALETFSVMYFFKQGNLGLSSVCFKQKLKLLRR